MTATLLTVAELRTHVETALVDDAVQRLLDSAEDDIDKNCGTLDMTGETPDDKTEWFTRSVLTSSLRMPMDVAAIVSVEEYGTASDLSDDIVALTEDEEYWVDGNVVRRKDGKLFGNRVKVVFTPADVRSRRRAALIQLVKLEINADPGTGFEGAGSWQHTTVDYEQQRQHILWSLCPPPTLA